MHASQGHCVRSGLWVGAAALRAREEEVWGSVRAGTGRCQCPGRAGLCRKVCYREVVWVPG